MDNRSKALASFAPSLDPHDRVSELRENWRLARTAHRDLLLTGAPRLNLLLVGIDGVVHNLLDLLLPDLELPIANWSPGTRLVLPPVGKVRTLILNDARSLTLEDQLHLFEWLERSAGRTQIVSTTTTPLLDRVHTGEFIETLYYRLNTVCVDLST